jgi:hypothetical protein
MGWLVGPLYIGYNSREQKEHKDAYLRAQCKAGGNNPAFSNVVLKSAFVGSTWFAAMQVNRPGVESRVVALVFLTSSRMADHPFQGYVEFGYKDMDESVGPREVHCPLAIMKLLTPLQEHEQYAKEWRAQVYAYHATLNETRGKRNSSIGRHIRLPHPVTYRGGVVVTEGQVVTRRTRRGRNKVALLSNGRLYQLPLKVLKASTLVLPPANAA